MEGRPFLKWVGGKRQIMPELLARVPSVMGTYFEPFIGGGALFFAIKPVRAVLADLNLRLVRTYRGVQRSSDKVIKLLRTYPYEETFYYKQRALDIDSKTDAELAAWFIYLNKTGFNGLYRVNSKNRVNVPFGRHASPNICDAVTIHSCAAALSGAEIIHQDFETVLERAREGDFVYLDPPYVPISATSYFTSYTADGFGWPDQVRLHAVAQRLRACGANILLSNADSPEIRSLYSDFTVEVIPARRSINSNRTARGAVDELLIR